LFSSKTSTHSAFQLIRLEKHSESAEQASAKHINHRLNGSSSPVLTATSLSYGKAKNLTPTESKPVTWLR